MLSDIHYFFASYPDHRDLHSFPTRRSSDLVGEGHDFAEMLSEMLGELNASHTRSEEHTSELQSLRHLVCRLLLEKKKETSQLQPEASSQEHIDSADALATRQLSTRMTASIR